MICDNCNREMNDSSNFCPYCAIPMNTESNLSRTQKQKYMYENRLRHSPLSMRWFKAYVVILLVSAIFGILYFAITISTVFAAIEEYYAWYIVVIILTGVADPALKIIAYIQIKRLQPLGYYLNLSILIYSVAARVSVALISLVFDPSSFVNYIPLISLSFAYSVLNYLYFHRRKFIFFENSK